MPAPVESRMRWDSPYHAPVLVGETFNWQFALNDRNVAAAFALVILAISIAATVERLTTSNVVAVLEGSERRAPGTTFQPALKPRKALSGELRSCSAER